MMKDFFKSLTTENTNVDKVKMIMEGAEGILENSKALLRSIIDMTSAFDQSKTPFGSNVHSQPQNSPFGSTGPNPFNVNTADGFMKQNSAIFGGITRFIDINNVNNLGDVLDFVASETKSPITYGVKSIPEEAATFVIASNIFIVENNTGDISLHINLDANAMTIKKNQATRIATAVGALVFFVKACIEFTSSTTFKQEVQTKFIKNSLYLKFGSDMLINAGVVALIIKVLKDTDATHGFEFCIGDYRCKVDRDMLLVSKDGYSPSSIPVSSFYFLYTNTPLFKLVEIDDKDFTQYGDNPNELFIRMILELMKTHSHFITMDDIRIIDNVFNANIRNMPLGMELKKVRK